MSERVAALIVAAGAGRRFGGDVPKVFAELGGLPLLAWSLRAYDRHPEVDCLVVVAPADHLVETQALCAVELRHPFEVVAGGSERRVSVLNGLRALAGTPPDLVAIHDGARPLVSAAVISASLAVARQHGAALAMVGVVDTVKETEPDGLVRATLDRSRLQLAQTPQTFRYELIRAAHEQAASEGWAVTDDAVLLERLGHPVYRSLGERRNLKITTPEDLPLAEFYSRGTATKLRIGHGFDLHRLVEGRPLVLGGIEVPYERGLLGHSDADAALHAVCDAVLGAAGLGDIGRHFPDTDPAYKDADSRALTARVAALAAEAGWQAGNVDVTTSPRRRAWPRTCRR